MEETGRQSGQSSSIRYFEQTLPEGWVYPCTLAEIEQKLMCLPQGDMEGLWAVGLAASTRKDFTANGRYFFYDKPTIALYSHPASYSFKLRPHTKRRHIEYGLAVELEYAIEIEQAGSRFICHWKPEDLRRFILCHVLLHEVGHHVYRWKQKQEGRPYRRNHVDSEQFAEAYALRYNRLQSTTLRNQSGR